MNKTIEYVGDLCWIKDGFITTAPSLLNDSGQMIIRLTTWPDEYKVYGTKYTFEMVHNEYT